jgi:hypothetical protein
MASTVDCPPVARRSIPPVIPVRHSHSASTCNNFCVQENFKLVEIGKNHEISPLLILQVLQLAIPWPDDRPQYYFRSGKVTRHAPAIFFVSHKFLNWQKWAKIMKSYLYSYSPDCISPAIRLWRIDPASATRITHLNFSDSGDFFGLSTPLQVPSGSAATIFLWYTVSLPNMVIRWASSGSTGPVYVDTLYGFTTPCYTIHCS